MQMRHNENSKITMPQIHEVKKKIKITQVWHLLSPSERMHSYEFEEFLWA